MREGYPIAASFLVLVPNRGFPPFFGGVISKKDMMDLLFIFPLFSAPFFHFSTEELPVFQS
jgi:hypothetical protein